MSFFKKLTDTVSKGVTTATEKAQQTVETTRLNAQISSKRKEIERIFTKIGESVYEAYQEKDLSLAEDKVIPGCEEITTIYAEIAAIDDRIKAIRNEKECVCGKRVPSDTRFCPSCGHPFPEPEPEVELEPESAVIDEAPIQVEAYVPAEATDGSGLDLTKDEMQPVTVTDQRQVCKNCQTPMFGDSHFCPTCGQATR